MAKKFNLNPADYDIAKATQLQEEIVEEKEAVVEGQAANEAAPEPQKESKVEPKSDSETAAKVEVPAEENKTVVQPATGFQPAPILPGNEEVFRIKVTQIAKKETLSKNKMIKLKPSVEARINQILAEKYPGMSFNSLVNQLLQGWLDEADAVDVESTEKQ